MPLTAKRVLKQFRYAMYFNGVNNYVCVKDSDSLHIFGSMTIFYWVIPYFKPVYQAITTKWDGNYYHEIFVSGLTDSNRFYAIHRNTNGDRIYVETSKTYASGLWYSVTVIYDLANLSIIVDGSKSSVPYSGTLYPNTGDLFVGQRGDRQFWSNVYLANLLIYSRALSDSEIQWNYQNPDKPIRNGLVLWLQADPAYVKDIDGDGVLEWVDLSGYGNHGKIYGAQLVQLIKTPARLLPPKRVLAPAR